MNWTAISGLAAAIAALGSIVGIWIAYRAFKAQTSAIELSSEQFRLSLSVDLVIKLEERFNSDAIKKARRLAAKALLTKRDIDNVDDVLDFFETLGLLTRLKGLKEEMVYSIFFHWINCYWTAAHHYVGEMRRDTITAWEDAEYAYKAVLAIEQKRDPRSQDIQLSDARLKKFLEDESSL
jgi:hypothetical protein